VDVLEPQVIAGDVQDDRHVVASVAEALTKDAAARHLEHREVHARVLQDHLRRFRSAGVGAQHQALVDVDAVVDVMPTWRPMRVKMCEIIRVVVVFPLDPVTATMGMRDGVPSGNSRSITGLATYCGSPSVGACACGTPARR
jgi:hypothetical protein